MASPQAENGFTPISNELLDVILGIPFIATHLKIILCCCRYTYGFHRKEAKLSVSYICKATGISHRYISQELNVLISQNIITVVQESTYTTPRIIALNKNYEQWERGTTVPEVNHTSTEEPTQDTPEEPQFSTPEEPQFPQENKSKTRVKQDAQNRSKNTNMSEFDLFYSAYPRKVGKQDAVKAWKKLRMTDDLFVKIMDKIEQYKKTEQWTKNNGQYIPHPASWLNGRRWEDELQIKIDTGSGEVKYSATGAIRL